MQLDIIINHTSSTYNIDIIVTFRSIYKMESTAKMKIIKYSHMCNMIPFCIGPLGSQYPGNDILKEEFYIL